MRRVVTDGDGEEQRFDAAGPRSLPKPVASRVVRLAVQGHDLGEGPAWTQEAVEAVLDLAAGRPGAAATCRTV